MLYICNMLVLMYFYGCNYLVVKHIAYAIYVSILSISIPGFFVFVLFKCVVLFNHLLKIIGKFVADLERTRDAIQHPPNERPGDVRRHPGHHLHQKQKPHSQHVDDCTQRPHGHLPEPSRRPGLGRPIPVPERSCQSAAISQQPHSLFLLHALVFVRRSQHRGHPRTDHQSPARAAYRQQTAPMGTSYHLYRVDKESQLQVLEP